MGLTHSTRCPLQIAQTAAAGLLNETMKRRHISAVLVTSIGY